MRHLEVLVITKDTTTPKILNWKVSTVNNVETAIEKLQAQPYAILAISNTIDEIDKIKVQQIAPVLSKQIIVVSYNIDSLLSEIVKTAYWSKNKPDVAREYLDNAFELQLANSLN